MASRRAVGLAFLVLLVMAAGPAPAPVDGAKTPRGLTPGFYRRKCPQFNRIVETTVNKWLAIDVKIAPMLVRLLFHDAVVNGIDASIMLNSTASHSGEKDAVPNRSLNGFFVIDDIKAQLEVACPGVVSCADILVTSVRDMIVARQGPFYPVWLGRRDGVESNLALAITNNPSPSIFVDGVLAAFGILNLGVADAVALSGAHTLGRGACVTTRRRFTNFNGTGQPDPTIPADLLAQMVSNCSIPGFRMDLDPITPTVFDNKYYINLVKGRGVFQSDQYLLFDPRTKPLVLRFATNQRAFFAQFRSSIFALSNVGVLTGTQGEIRHNCAVVNGPAAAAAPPPAIAATPPPAIAATPPAASPASVDASPPAAPPASVDATPPAPVAAATPPTTAAVAPSPSV